MSTNINSSPRQVRFAVACKPNDDSIVRRAATYPKHNWDYDSVQSLTSKYVGEPYLGRANKLKAEVKVMLEKALEPINQLELLDTLQRLGLAHHFVDEAKNILKSMFHDTHIEDTETKADLYATALEFRLLRQHGHLVPQEVFNRFKDERGNFRANVCSDIKGMLHLYEASYYSVEGESILDDARNFTSKHLENYVKQCDSNEYLSMLVIHTLETPLAWRVLRFEASWFIKLYESQQNMEPILLELAKLDFNMTQATHQEELKHSSSWWKKTGLAEKLDFVRAWSMESFFWSVGFKSEPEFGYFRRMMTKVIQLTTVLDDIYDVYGTLNELELLTDVIVRWDINAMDQLPHYMKLYFLTLYNSVNEMAYDFLKDQGFNIIPYLKKAWAAVSKSFLLEAKWYHAGYTPTLEEYLENGWISITVPTMLRHAYFWVTNPIKMEKLQYLEEFPNVIRWSCIIVRLLDDLATSSDEQKRGDAPKSIQCYMHDTGASEEEAYDHIRNVVFETWKKINGDRFSNPIFFETHTEVSLNIVRTSQSTFLHEEGYEVAIPKAKDLMRSILVDPIN
ncbi:unnamed protein product [Dovyalis caffra]|uniref:Isoprene synthase, chloroplastic n=1 Tax=Dovyalis caffra TaxID=77055 RepID=A0AAV1S4J6_9ROSI|nr:unnamed protein product [Dovyalis caffra]